MAEILSTGYFQFTGLDPAAYPTGILIRGKSAASRLGLGNYDSTDIWQIPFTTYVETLRETKGVTQQFKSLSSEQEGTLKASLDATLTLIAQEIRKAEKSLSSFATNDKRILQREIDVRKKVAEQVAKRLAAMHHKRLLQDDEELLLLLL